MISRRAVDKTFLRATTWLLLPLAACSSTGVGNPGQVTLAIVSADEAPSTPVTTESESGVLLRAVVVLAELRLVPCAADAPPLRFPGPFLADLVAGTLSPQPPPLAATGSYCRLEAPLAAASRPAALAGRSVLLHGRRADGVEVLLYAALSGTLRANARVGALEVSAEGVRWLWGLRPARWVERNELAAAPRTSLRDGRRFVVLDADRLPLLLEQVRRRLGGASTVYNDADGDGRLSPTERAEENIVADGSTEVDP